jgi:hypothetical protein
MKIIRKQFDSEGNLKGKVVLRNNATLVDFKLLQQKAVMKAYWGHGTPSVTNWLKRCQVHTATGNWFEFQLIN